MNRSIFQIWQPTLFFWLLNFFKNIFNFTNIIISIIIVFFFKVNVAYCEPSIPTIVNSLNNFNVLKSGYAEFLVTKNITLTRAMHGFNNLTQIWTPQCWNPNLIHFLTPNGQHFPRNHFASHHHFWIFQDTHNNLSWVLQFTHGKPDLEFFHKIFKTDLNGYDFDQYVSSHLRCIDNNEFIVNNSKIILNNQKFELIKSDINNIMIKNKLMPHYFNNFKK